MAARHVLEGDGNTYKVVCHVATPLGNNAVGNAWSAVIVAAGINKSILPVGNGLGEITTAENNQITAGTLLEVVLNIKVPNIGTLVQKQAALNNGTANGVAEELAKLQATYNFYGYTNG